MKTIDEMMHETDVPVVVADHRGLITHVNERFGAAFGWAGDEIIGRMLTAIVPSSFHDAHQLGFSRFLTTGQPTLLNQPLELKVVTKEGREIDAEHIIIAEQHRGQWVFGATIRPLREQ
ncbi:MAG: PAS domain S-box protein [Anaerolineae bacterium]